jgi:heme/copper-type cytochrome/quinol oxidase subunit 4
MNAVPTNGPTLATTVQVIVTIVNQYIIPLLYAFAFLFLVFGLVRYFFLESSSDESREKGKKVVLYGVIGMAVLFSVWGLVNLLLSILTSSTL